MTNARRWHWAGTDLHGRIYKDPCLREWWSWKMLRELIRAASKSCHEIAWLTTFGRDCIRSKRRPDAFRRASRESPGFGAPWKSGDRRRNTVSLRNCFHGAFAWPPRKRWLNRNTDRWTDVTITKSILVKSCFFNLHHMNKSTAHQFSFDIVKMTEKFGDGQTGTSLWQAVPERVADRNQLFPGVGRWHELFPH